MVFLIYGEDSSMLQKGGCIQSMKANFEITLALIALCIFLCACGKQMPNHNALSAGQNARLYKLAHLNGCLDCHTVTSTSIGPSWMVIAERYKDAPRAEAQAMLVNSVMNGSRGKWHTLHGDGGMPPLGKRVVKRDVEELVDFILSLKH